MILLLGFLRKIPVWIWPILALTAAAGVQTWRLHSAQTTVAQERADVVAYQSAQATNLAAIARLKVTNGDYAKTCDLNLKNANHTVKAALQYAQAQQSRAASAEAKLENIYAHIPGAKNWSVALVPAPVDRRVRHSAPGSAHGNGGGT